MDPRGYQIAALAALLAYGLCWLRFDIQPDVVVTLLATALAVQWCCWRAVSSSKVDYKSAVISALSLCLLLRTGSPLVAAVAATLAIVSKFAVRVRGKHVFNPTNFGIVAMLLLTRDAWVSSGQWGEAALFGFFVASIGMIVVTRAARADVTFGFLCMYAGLLISRSAWLGEPLAIPLHRLQSGALLIFAFFMISDPKTTPDSRTGRMLFALLVATGAYYVQFGLFRPNGLLWSLAAWSPVVPLLDRMRRAERYGWNKAAAQCQSHGGNDVEQDTGDAGGIGGDRDRAADTSGGLLWFLRRPRGREALQHGVAGRPRT
jgi:Na+-transporting NADH:ubiquinone oxidoreductase subunit NqrB